uniref:Uncharacterized protein n=1 Tax=Sinocyclocheilus grahami TaxID=75366 RepID=A0A672KA16_SINGR
MKTHSRNQTIRAPVARVFLPTLWPLLMVSLLSRVSSLFRVSLCCFSGVIAVVIFVSLAALAVMARFLYRRKETFQPQEPKVGKTDDSPETPFNTDPNSQSIVSDYQKEYFI